MLGTAILIIDDDVLSLDSEASEGKRAKPKDFVASKANKKIVEMLQAKGLKKLKGMVNRDPKNKKSRTGFKKGAFKNGRNSSQVCSRL